MNVKQLLISIHGSVPFKVRVHIAMDEYHRIVVRMRTTIDGQEYGHEQTLNMNECRWEEEIKYNGRSFESYIRRKGKKIKDSLYQHVTKNHVR